jgi:hypothetical protein
LLQTERHLRASNEENVRLKAYEKKALGAVQIAKNGRKATEAGLLTAERQVTKWSEKYDRELECSSILRGDISALKAELNEAQAVLQKAEDSAQSYYDQGFDEATTSLKSQLVEECNKHFIQGWHVALDRAGVDDASELYDLGPRRRPFRPASPEQHEEAGVTEGQMDFEAGDEQASDEQIPVVEFQEGEGDSDGKGTLDVTS